MNHGSIINYINERKERHGHAVFVIRLRDSQLNGNGVFSAASQHRNFRIVGKYEAFRI